MKGKNTNVEYDNEYDTLYIYGDNAGREKVAGSIVAGNLVFDISHAGNFIGLEIDNASDVLELGPRALSKIKSARLKTYVQGNVIIMAFMVDVDKKEYNYSYMVPRNKLALTP